MRLTEESRKIATRILLNLLAGGPKKTRDIHKAMINLFYKHPGQVLSLWQIRILLRESGRVQEKRSPHGLLWVLKPIGEQPQ